MTENLKRLRGPAGWVVIAVIVVYEITSASSFIVPAVAPKPGAKWWWAVNSASMPVSVVWVLALLAIVLCCLLIKPTAAHTRQLALWGSGVVAVSVAMGIFYLVCAMVMPEQGWGKLLDGVGRVIEVLVDLTAMIVLLRLARQIPDDLVTTAYASGTQPGAAQAGTGAAQTGNTQSASGQADATQPAPGAPPAVGAQWTRAADAASGAPPVSWAPPSTDPNGSGPGTIALGPSGSHLGPSVPPRPERWSRG